MARLRVLTTMLLVLIALSICGAACKAATAQSPLDAYISRPDSSYTWAKEEDTRMLNGVTMTRISMTSQTWQGIVWKHELDILRPEKLRDGSTALLLITGGHGSAGVLNVLSQASNVIGMPIAVLFDIPNQPLFGGKREDEIIAYTFIQCLKTGDNTWPLLFPMTKSAVRAMDTIQKISETEWKSPVKGFVVTGASKRGWTTWLTGVVDKRVVGIAPSVYDNLNLPAQMKQQVEYYGKYSEMISDYSENQLPQLLSSDQGREFARMVDPYTFVSRLTMPKLLLLGSNDPYWTLESANLYFNDLPGDKHIVYVPNIGHEALTQSQSLSALGNFAIACSEKKTLNKIDWSYSDKPDGLELSIRPTGAPTVVKAWTALSDTRDFRKAKWTDQKITSTGDSFNFTLSRPKSGYAAVFGEVTYAGKAGPLSLSTIPKILPAK